MFFSRASGASAFNLISWVLAGFVLRCLIMFFMLGGIVITQDAFLPPDSWLVGQRGFEPIKQFEHWQIGVVVVALCFTCRWVDNKLYGVIDL